LTNGEDDRQPANDGGNGDLLLQKYLRDNDAACPVCGYNRRGLMSRRCPEGGRDLRLTIGLVEPHLREWIAATVAMCANAGIGLFFTLIVAQNGFPPGSGFALLRFLIVAYILTIPLAVVLVRSRRTFQRQSRDWQLRAAGFVIAATIAIFVLLIFSLER
jgi:hypothetical protein